MKQKYTLYICYILSVLYALPSLTSSQVQNPNNTHRDPFAPKPGAVFGALHPAAPQQQNSVNGNYYGYGGVDEYGNPIDPDNYDGMYQNQPAFNQQYASPSINSLSANLQQNASQSSNNISSSINNNSSNNSGGSFNNQSSNDQSSEDSQSGDDSQNYDSNSVNINDLSNQLSGLGSGTNGVNSGDNSQDSGSDASQDQSQDPSQPTGISGIVTSVMGSGWASLAQAALFGGPTIMEGINGIRRWLNSGSRNQYTTVANDFKTRCQTGIDKLNKAIDGIYANTSMSTQDKDLYIKQLEGVKAKYVDMNNNIQQRLGGIETKTIVSPEDIKEIETELNKGYNSIQTSESVAKNAFMTKGINIDDPASIENFRTESPPAAPAKRPRSAPRQRQTLEPDESTGLLRDFEDVAEGMAKDHI